MPTATLVLIRHAQAADAPVDADRPLTERGRRQATAVGEWLQRTGLQPDRVLVSPARRAQQTWAGAAAALPQAPEPAVDERLYDNTVETVLAAVAETPGEAGVLLVVGHNPSMGHLTDLLDGGDGDPAVRDTFARGFPPGSVAVFALGTSFDAITPGSATLTGAVTAES